MKKLTKEGIESLALRIAKLLKDRELASDVRIYFNNRCIDFDSGHWDPVENTYVVNSKIIEDINPHDYFECAHDHIISMSYEGPLYDYFYNRCEFPRPIEELIRGAGLYYEHWDAWNLTFYVSEEDMEVEYTKYEKPEEAEYIWLYADKYIPEELKRIMLLWHDLGWEYGDHGSCVIGARMDFRYNGKRYEMGPCTGWQGSESWEHFVPRIKEELIKIGATEISYDYGRLD